MDSIAAVISPVTVPTCDKCKDPLKPNNEFTGHDNKRMCGECWKEYQSYVTKFFD